VSALLTFWPVACLLVPDKPVDPKTQPERQSIPTQRRGEAKPPGTPKPQGISATENTTAEGATPKKTEPGQKPAQPVIKVPQDVTKQTAPPNPPNLSWPNPSPHPPNPSLRPKRTSRNNRAYHLYIRRSDRGLPLMLSGSDPCSVCSHIASDIPAQPHSVLLIIRFAVTSHNFLRGSAKKPSFRHVDWSTDRLVQDSLAGQQIGLTELPDGSWLRGVIFGSQTNVEKRRHPASAHFRLLWCAPGRLFSVARGLVGLNLGWNWPEGYLY